MAAVVAPRQLIRLPPVRASPTTWQYARSNAPDSPYYRPRFRMKKEDWDKTLTKPLFAKTDPLMPPYPYGKNYDFPEANYGLYGGSSLQSGNKISKGRNKGKTLRKWHPNVRVEELRSEALDQTLTLPVTARTMRTINKVGGLDNYVLGDKPARIKELGLLGWKLRWLVMTSPAGRDRIQQEREALGLTGTSPVLASFEAAFRSPDGRQKIIEQQESAWAGVRESAQRFETHWKTNMGKYIDGGKVRPISTLDTYDPASLLEKVAMEWQPKRREQKRPQAKSADGSKSPEPDQDGIVDR